MMKSKVERLFLLFGISTVIWLAIMVAIGEKPLFEPTVEPTEQCVWFDSDNNMVMADCDEVFDVDEY